MVNDDYMNSVILTIDVNVPKIVDLLTEIRDLLRAERANPTPTPEPDLVARWSGGQQWPRAEESDSPTVAALAAAMRCHGWSPSVALPGELEDIASAVARARDRQVAEWLRQCRHESSSPMRAHEIDANVRLLADRIEAGAVDETSSDA